MRYSIDYQQVSEDQEFVRPDDRSADIVFNSEHGLALIPCVGDVVNLPSTAVKAGFVASSDQEFSIISGVLKSFTATSIFLLKRPTSISAI